MPRALVWLAILVAVFARSGPVEAQASGGTPAATAPGVVGQPVVRPAPRPRPVVVQRALAWFGAGYTPWAGMLQSTVGFTRYAERGSVSTVYPPHRGVAIDVGAGARVWRDLVAGVAGTWFGSRGTAPVTARIPHPFFFDTFREVRGQSPVLPRRESAAHAFAMWMLALGPSMQLGVFGGPTYFSVTQRLVTDVDVTDIYPYDQATFNAALTEERTASAVGFNAGTDFTYLLNKRIGLGAAARYSRGTVQFRLANGQDIPSTAGGLVVTGGLRLRF